MASNAKGAKTMTLTSEGTYRATYFCTGRNSIACVVVVGGGVLQAEGL